MSWPEAVRPLTPNQHLSVRKAARCLWFRWVFRDFSLLGRPGEPCADPSGDHVRRERVFSDEDAFPDGQDTPAAFAQERDVAFVPLTVGAELILPELAARFSGWSICSNRANASSSHARRRWH